MKKYLLSLGLVLLTNHTNAQINELRRMYFNECMANRNVTRDNERYQIAFCNDKANLELQNLKSQAFDKLNEAKKLFISANEFKDINGKNFEYEGDGPPNMIGLYNELNMYQNPFLQNEYRQIVKSIYLKLKPLSAELIRVYKIKTQLAIGRDERCKQEEKTGRLSNDCAGYGVNSWYNFNNEASLSLQLPK